jgi:hypothetical protein
MRNYIADHWAHAPDTVAAAAYKSMSRVRWVAAYCVLLGIALFSMCKCTCFDVLFSWLICGGKYLYRESVLQWAGIPPLCGKLLLLLSWYSMMWYVMVWYDGVEGNQIRCCCCCIRSLSTIRYFSCLNIATKMKQRKRGSKTSARMA